jgi:predicted negative regulator of RcsB-dependent stress response
LEGYVSEREQIAEVRRFIRENAPWALAGVLIGVGALVGWQQWQAWRERQSLAAGQKYGLVLDALTRNDRDAATRLVAQLRQDYARTPYVDLAALALARYHVEFNELADAERELAAVMSSSRDQELKVVARLRLARVQRAEGKPDDALATLAAAPSGAAQAAALAEVRGDVLRDKGDQAGALAAYQVALAAPPEAGVNRALIALKSADLGAAPAGPTAGAAAPAAAPGATGARP